MVYKKQPIQNLYNNPLVKKLCVARVKKLWGLILGKYKIQIPGGGTSNGDSIHQEGVDEEKADLHRRKTKEHD
jgi:hypothetical protein